MARRDENYLFTRRIADRGSDKIVFDLQDRMIQETDPKDVIWDEIVGKGEHPEEGDGYKFQETDPKGVIWDEIVGKEEHPESCIYHPVYDEYEDEEWYYWMTGVTNDPTGIPFGFASVVWVKASSGSNSGLGMALDQHLIMLAKPALEKEKLMLMPCGERKGDVSSNWVMPHVNNNDILDFGLYVKISQLEFVVDLMEVQVYLRQIFLSRISHGDIIIINYVFDPGGLVFEVIKTRGRVFFEEEENDKDMDC